MEPDEMCFKWAEYRSKIKQFETKKERELQNKKPNMRQEEIDVIVSRAVDRKFKNIAQYLLKIQLSSAQNFRNI